jgi:L-threonylcarbamoyladenylate synthase
LNTTIISITSNNSNQLLPAADSLRSGGLVAFPTETVYGLGAVFNNEAAIRNIFAVKGRPADNPLIVHIWNRDQLVSLTDRIAAPAAKLIEQFWPGPLTLILPKRPEVPDIVTAGLDTVAVRMPSHPVARELLRLTGLPVAAPSANLSGRPSTTKGSHVIEDLNGKIDFIVEAGPCQAGIESTVLVLEPKPVILRPGSVTREMLEAALGEPVELPEIGEVGRPQAPGMKYRHYAPQAPVLLFEGDSEGIVNEINHRLQEKSPALRAVVLSTTENIGRYRNEWVLDLGPRDHPETAAIRLYDLLRFCDQLNTDLIYIEGMSEQGVGLAVSNRLRKAAGGKIIHVS